MHVRLKLCKSWHTYTVKKILPLEYKRCSAASKSLGQGGDEALMRMHAPLVQGPGHAPTPPEHLGYLGA